MRAPCCDGADAWVTVTPGASDAGPGPLLEGRAPGADPEAGHAVRFGGAACQPPAGGLSWCQLCSSAGEAWSIDEASGLGSRDEVAAGFEFVPK